VGPLVAGRGRPFSSVSLTRDGHLGCIRGADDAHNPDSPEPPMPRLKTSNDLLGTSLAASYLGVHRSSLRAWMLGGVIVPTAVEEGPRGPLFKFSKDALDRFREEIDFNA
jgi:hypothetical protein